MRFVIALTALALCGAQVARMERLPRVGDKFTAPDSGATAGVCMVSPGQMDKCIKVAVHGIEYTVAYRRKSRLQGPTVTYIHTSDPAFRSPSGFRVGDSIDVDFAEVRKAPGFEVYAGVKKRGLDAGGRLQRNGDRGY